MPDTRYELVITGDAEVTKASDVTQEAEEAEKEED